MLTIVDACLQLCRHWGLSSGAGEGAVDEASPGQEGSPQQGRLAGPTQEAGGNGMPVLALVRHLALIDADDFAAGIAVLGKHAVEAAQAIGASLAHDVALPTELEVALVTDKVLHVPGATLGLGALIREYDLSE